MDAGGGQHTEESENYPGAKNILQINLMSVVA
jgi:hypothetical protein